MSLKPSRIVRITTGLGDEIARRDVPAVLDIELADLAIQVGNRVALVIVKAMASVIGGQEGLREWLGVGLATGADTAIGEWLPAGARAQ